MAASAYMLSLLVRQYLFLVDAFQNRYPSSWLVWEPGAWRPARTTLEGNSASTRLAEDTGPARPAGSDALCFELKNGTAQLTLGRSSESDIFINDLTLSREHLVLTWAGTQWQATVAPTSSVATQVEGKPIAQGVTVPLKSGMHITAGDVHLTFYDVVGFLARLREEAARPARA
ncbi:MAG: FHA domain-containing protein [Myxococcota bacterium]